MIGAFVIGALNDGLVIMGVSSFWQMVIKGAVIVLALIFDQMQAATPGPHRVAAPTAIGDADGGRPDDPRPQTSSTTTR